MHITGADRMVVFLNTLLLADVAFLPFPTSLLAKAISSRQGLSEATFFYGLVLTIGGVFFNALWLYARSKTQHAPKQTASKHLRRISIRYVLGPIAYLLATLCSLKWPVLSIVLYVLLIVHFLASGEVGRTARDVIQAAHDADTRFSACHHRTWSDDPRICPRSTTNPWFPRLRKRQACAKHGHDTAPSMDIRRGTIGYGTRIRSRHPVSGPGTASRGPRGSPQAPRPVAIAPSHHEPRCRAW